MAWLVSTSAAIDRSLEHASLLLQASASLVPLQNDTTAATQPPQALLTLTLASTLTLPASLDLPSLRYTQQCYAMANALISCRDITHHLRTPVFLVSTFAHITSRLDRLPPFPEASVAGIAAIPLLCHHADVYVCNASLYMCMRVC